MSDFDSLPERLTPPRPTARVPDRRFKVIFEGGSVRLLSTVFPRGRPGKPVIDSNGVVYASYNTALSELGISNVKLYRGIYVGQKLWLCDEQTAREVFGVDVFTPSALPQSSSTTTTTSTASTTCRHVWQDGSDCCMACGASCSNGADTLKEINYLLDDFDVPRNADLLARLRFALMDMEAAKDLLRKTRALFNPEK